MGKGEGPIVQNISNWVPNSLIYKIIYFLVVGVG
jgi:hypothetical protein